MTRKSRRHRTNRKPGVAGALVRAALLVGPLAFAIVFGMSPGSDRERLVASNGLDGIDAMTTGSVAGSRFAFALGYPKSLDRSGPCLKFPEGGQRGAC